LRRSLSEHPPVGGRTSGLREAGRARDDGLGVRRNSVGMTTMKMLMLMVVVVVEHVVAGRAVGARRVHHQQRRLRLVVETVGAGARALVGVLGLR